MKYGEMKLRYWKDGCSAKFITKNHHKFCCTGLYELFNEVMSNQNIIIEAHNKPGKGRRGLRMGSMKRWYFYEIFLFHRDNCICYISLKDLHAFGIDYEKDTWFWISVREA